MFRNSRKRYRRKKGTFYNDKVECPLFSSQEARIGAEEQLKWGFFGPRTRQTDLRYTVVDIDLTKIKNPKVGPDQFVKYEAMESGMRLLPGDSPQKTAWIDYPLTKEDRLLRVAISPGRASRGVYTFEVFGDNELLWRSPREASLDTDRRCDILLEGLENLRLLVRQHVGQAAGEPPFWEQAQILKK